jgi:hypothetical protein
VFRNKRLTGLYYKTIESIIPSTAKMAIRSLIFLKKSQMNLKEMSFMIVALAIFFTLVLLFYLTISLSGLKKEVETGKRTGSILLVAKLAGSPEFACASSNSLCVDVDKIVVLLNHPDYARFWGNDVAGLRIEKIYPKINGTIECNMINYDRCTTFTIKALTTSNVIEDSSWVSLCRREYENTYNYPHCELGKIIVSTEAGKP